MSPETIALIKAIADESSILLSGFAGPEGQIAASLIRISLAAQQAHLLQTGVPIDPNTIKPIEPLTEDDLPPDLGEHKFPYD